MTRIAAHRHRRLRHRQSRRPALPPAARRNLGGDRFRAVSPSMMVLGMSTIREA